MSGNHTDTALHNVDFLMEKFNFKKDRRALSTRNDIAYLSPAVAKNSSNYYWFDIREANICHLSKTGFQIKKIIIRLVPNMFILIEWQIFLTIMDKFKYEKSGLKKWEFLIIENFTKIKNRNSNKMLNVSIIHKDNLQEI